MYSIFANFSGWGVKYGTQIVFFTRDTESAIENKREKAKAKIEEIKKTGIENYLPKPSEPQEEPITQDEINAEILLNQATIQAKQAEHDEVLAQLLLNSVTKEV